jgi:hypothetical protein
MGLCWKWPGTIDEGRPGEEVGGLSGKRKPKETPIKFEKDESRFLDFAGLPERRAIPLRSE